MPKYKIILVVIIQVLSTHLINAQYKILESKILVMKGLCDYSPSGFCPIQLTHVIGLIPYERTIDKLYQTDFYGGFGNFLLTKESMQQLEFISKNAIYSIVELDSLFKPSGKNSFHIKNGKLKKWEKKYKKDNFYYELYSLKLKYVSIGKHSISIPKFIGNKFIIEDLLIESYIILSISNVVPVNEFPPLLVFQR